MNRRDLIQTASYLVENASENYISEDRAINKAVVGMKIFEAPIFGVADSDDAYFKILKRSHVIGEHFLLPKEWLPQAKSVISFFLPFSEAVRKGNRLKRGWPSEEWLHGRIEGQIFLNKLCRDLHKELIKSGSKSIIPSMDERYWSKAKDSSNPLNSEGFFTTNWSERHVAFVCGLGTFGLSRGLITERGTAGRFGSIITELKLSADVRKYEKYNEYCSKCLQCVKNCPVNAISVEDGKDNIKCSDFIDRTNEKFKPRYGCGKCQTGVPCEHRVPSGT